MKTYFEIVESSKLEDFIETNNTSKEIWADDTHRYHCLWFSEFRELPLTIRRERLDDPIN